MVLMNIGNVKKVDVDTEKIWDSMGSFSKYSFNKSHSVAYSMIGYVTVKLYTYRWEEFIQYQLNFSSAEKFEVAFQELKEKRYKPEFPNYQNMKHEKFIVFSDRTRVYKDGSKVVPDFVGFESGQDYELLDDGSKRRIIIPAKEFVEYDNLKDALFDGTITGAAFLKGCFEYIIDGNKNNKVFTKDREGLLDLINAIPKKGKDKMMYAPIDNNTTFVELLDMMVQAEVVTRYEKTKTNGYDIYVKPFRGNDKLIHVRSNNNSDVLLENISYDTKYFGITRNGLIGEAPSELKNNEMFWTSFQRALENKKERGKEYYGEGWYENNKVAKKKYLDSAKEALQEKLNHPKYKESEENNPRILEPIRAIVVDLKAYDRSVKLTLKFADKEDFFYVQTSWYDALKKLNKKAVVSVVFYFNPFIQYRAGDYVEDYDLIRITDLESGNFLDKNAVKLDYIDDDGKEIFKPNNDWTDTLRKRD